MRRSTRSSAGGASRSSATSASATVRRLVLRSEPCPRKALAAAAQEGGYSLATLSRLLDRDADYVPRFVRNGCPLALSAADHQTIADFLGIHPARLGIRDLWRSAA